MKKTFLKRTIFAPALVVLALLLVTCIGEPPGDDPGGAVEFTDVEYSSDGRSVTLYLDGIGVPVTPQSRALSKDLAKRANDFFEVVFVHAGTVARASWGLGMNAGISGIARDQDYGTVSGTTAAVLATGKSAGAGKTLLGLGRITEVRQGGTLLTGTTVTTGATSVTFTLYPLRTNLGWDPPVAPATVETWRGTDATATFRTAARISSDDPDNVLITNTLGRTVAVRGTAVKFPFFQLPPPPVAPDETDIAGIYRIGGLTAATPADPLDPPTTHDFKSSLLVTALPTGEVKIATFMDAGQIFDASSAYDLGTDLKSIGVLGGQTLNAALAASEILVVFTQKSNSSGVFMWTFQMAVSVLSIGTADNGGPNAETWYIRPGFGQYQYLLDNGTDPGGAVLMGNDMGDSDWLQIFHVWVGDTP
jgi:hypothetical protein